MAEELNYQTILIELNKAVKMHNFYPQGHPNLDSALAKCFSLLKRCIDERGEIRWKIGQKGFYDGKTVIDPESLELALLSKKFLYRKIRELAFTPRLRQGDLKIILQIIKLEPEELAVKGGAEVFLAGKETEGILLNEMRYEDLLKLKKELEEKRAREEEGDAAGEGLARLEAESGAPDGAKDGAKKGAPQPPAPPEEEAGLESLLERIKQETDFLKYHDLLVRIKEKAGALLAEKKFDEVFPALLLLLERASKESTLAAGIKQASLESLDLFLADDAVIRLLVEKVAQKEEPDRAAIGEMLLRGKDRAAEALLDALTEAPDAAARRNLYNAVIRFGRLLTPHAEARLKSDNWYAVRQMAALLGELAVPETAGALEAAFKNPHIQVKREVLKSIARIHAPRSTAFLLKALENEDPALMTYAVIALGMRRDPAAIDPLSKTALKWEPFSENHEPKKEAIKSLGLIRDPRAVPALIQILFRKTWLSKRINEEFRCLAANSLGMIGGEDAMKALDYACGHAEGELYTVCKRILNR